jgi:thiol-disulfide isomerase/thioredoxin
MGKDKSKKNQKSKKSLSIQKKQNKSQKKHVFGKVYAEWCGACQNLEPNWIEMIDKLKQQEKLNSQEWSKFTPDQKKQEMKKSIVINKDGTILEIIQIEDTDYDSFKSNNSKFSDLTANGFPTIFRKIENSPVEYYQGDRSPDDMINWALNRKVINNIGGSSKRDNKKHHNKTYKKPVNNCNSTFSQKISKFWGWN